MDAELEDKNENKKKKKKIIKNWRKRFNVANFTTQMSEKGRLRFSASVDRILHAILHLHSLL